MLILKALLNHLSDKYVMWQDNYKISFLEEITKSVSLAEGHAFK